jgi:hypothetical protein
VLFEKFGSSDNQVGSLNTLVRNLLGAGNLAEAQSAAEKAMALAEKSTDPTTRFEAVLADARVKAKMGKWAQARAELDSMLASARKFGYRAYEFEGRLAQGEIDQSAGSASAAAHLTALERDARAQGFLLMADQARALSQAR